MKHFKEKFSHLFKQSAFLSLQGGLFILLRIPVQQAAYVQQNRTRSNQTKPRQYHCALQIFG